MPTEVKRQAAQAAKGKLNADLPQNPYNTANDKPPKTRNSQIKNIGSTERSLLKPIETEYGDNVTGDGSFENNKEANPAAGGKQVFDKLASDSDESPKVKKVKGKL